MRGHHDLGGQPAGPVDRNDREIPAWEKRLDAIIAILHRKGVIREDEIRRSVELLGAARCVGYAGQRIEALADNLVCKGLVTVEALAAKLDALDQERGEVS